ncbi:MAG: M20 family metallopeptidase [Deltaproteobacteria bacterium]|nr:M20 family metallopeptidase [Deltaproteobacteria bacterium]
MNVGSVDVEGRDLVFACDMRTVPGCDYRALLKDILEQARACFTDVDLRFPHAPLPATWTDLAPSFTQALSGSLDEFGKAAYTEASVYAPAGLKPIIAGPGNLLVHRPNEHIEVSALEKGGDLYEKLATLVVGS